jgi:Asp-tRNA(Asn)/Glu-tRNA(Gln) amidotransferase A subunit family amidase
LDLNLLTATAAARAITSGEITAEELIRGCLARIDQREPTVSASARSACSTGSPSESRT